MTSCSILEESPSVHNELSRKQAMYQKAKDAHKSIVERFQKRILVQKVIEEHQKKIELREKSEQYVQYRCLTEQVRYPKSNPGTEIVPLSEVVTMLEREREEKKKLEAQEYEKFLYAKNAAKMAKQRVNQFPQKKMFVDFEVPRPTLPRKPRPPKFHTKKTKPPSEILPTPYSSPQPIKHVSEGKKVIKKSKKTKNKIILQKEVADELASVEQDTNLIKNAEEFSSPVTNDAPKTEEIQEDEEDIDKTNIDDVLNDILKENVQSPPINTNIEASEMQALQTAPSVPTSEVYENVIESGRDKIEVALNFLDVIENELQSIGPIEGTSTVYHSTVYQLDQISGYL